MKKKVTVVMTEAQASAAYEVLNTYFDVLEKREQTIVLRAMEAFAKGFEGKKD